MNRHIFLLELIITVCLAGCNNSEISQSSIATAEECQQDNLKQQDLESSARVITETNTETFIAANAETRMEAAAETEYDWRADHAAAFNLMYGWERADGGYAISNEDLTKLDGSGDFGFDLSDLQYEVVRALVKKIFAENHYTTYEFYEHFKDTDMTFHQENGIEHFYVIFDSTQYWFIYYCQGKAYALYDDTELLARERSAKALSYPGGKNNSEVGYRVGDKRISNRV